MLIVSMGYMQVDSHKDLKKIYKIIIKDKYSCHVDDDSMDDIEWADSFEVNDIDIKAFIELRKKGLISEHYLSEVHKVDKVKFYVD